MLLSVVLVSSSPTGTASQRKLHHQEGIMQQYQPFQLSQVPHQPMFAMLPQPFVQTAYFPLTSPVEPVFCPLKNHQQIYSPPFPQPINFHKAETRCTRQNSQELRSSQESQSSEEDGSESSGSKQNREQRSTTPKQYQQRSLTPQRIGEVVIQKKNKAFKQTTRGGDGYSSIPQELAFQLVKISRTIPEVCAERIAYVKRVNENKQNGKIDVLTENDCVELAGEIVPRFEETLRELKIFQNQGAVITYKKVPKTTLENKWRKIDNEENLLAYLFSRWMRIDPGSISLHFSKDKSNGHKVRVWRSVLYVKQHGSLCEMFVIVTKFNRHLFHRELLDD